jgi:hypothetical protein
MEDVKEISGTNTQLKTSRQLKISPTLPSALKSWNLGRLHPQNLILSFRTTHFGRMITKTIKSIEEGQNAKFEFDLD